MRFDQLPLMGDEWKDRMVSNSVKWMMEQGNRTSADIAKELKISDGAFRNKLTRNSFTIYELLVISRYCNVDIELKGPMERSWNPYDYYDDPSEELTDEYDE